MHKKLNTRLLPPLSSLKGFEAAARRQSIRGAAEELSLTHPAVSHQIEALEQALGTALFARVGRNIAPTEAGRLLYPYVRTALESLIEGVEAVQRITSERTLRVQAYVTASIRWLARRVPRFLAEHPNVKVMLSTCAVEWEFDPVHCDVGLVYCETPPDPGQFHWVPLFEYSLVPVCSPALAHTLPRDPQPADLLALPRIAIYTEARHWDAWSAAAGMECPKESLVMVDTLALALEMALEGAGVALANGPFMHDELESGRLVRPVALTALCPGHWGLICRRDMRNDHRVQTFINWIADNA